MNKQSNTFNSPSPRRKKRGDFINIGTLIRRARKEQKLTSKVIAEKASISEGFLSQVENDVNSPSVDTLVRICNAIGIDAGDLITQANNLILTR